MSVKSNKPNVCTSINNCNSYGSNFCKKCSHSIWYGREGTIKWEFKPYMGFEFYKLSESNRFREFDPNGDDPIWDVIAEWYDKYFKNNT